jgi:hypothetical protein
MRGRTGVFEGLTLEKSLESNLVTHSTAIEYENIIEPNITLKKKECLNALFGAIHDTLMFVKVNGHKSLDLRFT